MNLNNMGMGKHLIAQVLSQKKVKQWSTNQEQNSQTVSKSTIKVNKNEPRDR